MTVTLVRHAQVIEFYQGKYNGHIDIALSEHGKIQAKKLANTSQDKVFDAVYCSDLLRARETLEAFTYQVTPIFTAKLREKSWGKHEAKSFEEIEQSGIHYENFSQWIEALDGEDIKSFSTRVQHYFINVICKSKAENILVVSHSGVIRTILSYHNNISLEEAFATNLPYASSVEITIQDK